MTGVEIGKIKTSCSDFAINSVQISFSPNVKLSAKYFSSSDIYQASQVFVSLWANQL